MSYSERSGKIQTVLADMLKTFQGNQKDASDAENQAQSQFETLSAAKKRQLSEAQTALEQLTEEKGAAGVSRQEAADNVDDLKKQVTNDERFIEQARKALEEKTAEWKDRSELRAGELSSIAEAIHILHNDDSRDLFKKSFDSQGYMFTQLGQRTNSVVRRRDAASVLRKMAKSATDKRLNKVAQLALGHADFTEVLKAIDDMLTLLKEEEDKDLQTKETCESTRADSTRKALVAARTMDEKTDKITSLNGKIATAEEETANCEATIERLEQEKKDAQEQRDSEHKEFEDQVALDREAVNRVGQATQVLEKYFEEKFSLAQQAPAGEAPVPPPATWDAPYGGRSQEHHGIVSILHMIKEDINKDIQTAEDAENKALNQFNNLMTDLSAEQTANEDRISDLKTQLDSMRDDVGTNKADRVSQKEELDSQLKTLADMKEGCEFFLLNYMTRRANRHLEMDGLFKAKAILEGGSFEKPEDANRELKPGDA